MKFSATSIEGVWLIEMERHEDERGWFAREWCASELQRRGLDTTLSQCSVSFNHKRGTLRGMHFQAPPHEETKVVRCSLGALFDVVVDLRPDSPTYMAWLGIELTRDNGLMLYIPRGVAHGFQTLQDNTEIIYKISAEYHPASSRGVRWNDPVFGIRWPLDVSVISERDRTYPGYSPGK